MLSAACGGPADPVQALLASLEAAVEARDSEALAAHLAPDFSGQGGLDRARARDTLRRLLLGYEHASLEIYDVTQQASQAGVRVSCWVEFSGRPRALGGLSGMLPPGAVYRFELELRDAGGALELVAASWEAHSGPAAAAGEGGAA